MKNILVKQLTLTAILCFCIISLSTAQGTPGKWGDQGNGTYVNPILNADYSDPDVIRVGNKYYMVASDFHFMGMQVLESADMVNWKLISQIYNRFDFPAWEENKRYAGGSWAPAIRYHDNKFWVFFCTPHEGLFMSTAENPAGPWSPLHLVHAVEKWEDPCPFWDEDGTAYLGRSKHGAGPIILHKMSADGTRLLDDGVTIYTGPVAEGTKIHKRNGYYYMSIPEGGVEVGWQSVLRSKNIYGPYEKKIVLETGSTHVNGPHQGAIVDTPDGQWFFYHFQHAGSLGRVVHLQPMYWHDDWPVIGVDLDRNGIGEPVSVWKKPIKSTEVFAPQTDDDFTSETLSLQWQWNHNPVDRAWSLSTPGGMLTLKALKAPYFRLARNTLTQKIVGYKSEATVAMNFSEIAEGQRCGLACFAKESRVLGVKMEKGKKLLYFSNDTTETTIAEIADEIAYLRVAIDMDREAFQYFYSEDNIHFTSCGEPFFIKFGHWKGARIGLYSYNTQKEAGATSFQWFKYKHDGPQADTNDPAEKIIAGIARTSFANRDIRVTCPTTNSEDSQLPRKKIQQAIDSCSLLGGGRVVVEKGTYFLKGNLVLKSNVNLHLEEGAYLLFSGKATDFLPVVQTRWEGTELYSYSPMIYAYHADNIAITGKGTIDAQGGLEFAPWAEIEAPWRDRLRDMGEKVIPLYERVFAEGTKLRPSCIQFLGCSRILVEDVLVKNSPFWTIHPVYCDNVIVRGVTIDTHYPNNDGCDPESTSNVLIENCIFRTGDDAVAIKAGRDADGRSVGRPSRNIVIRNCLFHSECNGLCIGSEMSGGVENVYMDNIRIGTVKNALYFKSNRDRGGYIRNIHVSNIDIERAKGAILRFETNYFGFRGGGFVALYEDFFIRNVKAGTADNYAIFIDGYEEKPIRDIEIKNFSVAKALHSYYLFCTENIRFKNATVNNKALPDTPENSKERVSLDVY
ncbi:beta-xylosidase [Bacteroides sp. 214]|uniref:family 43 glycosylhydrolase n=1 Tax=Bacteroides sp. 214 TaxID=2302935 RepID=UPI0013D75069|nr:family 43 glycosylhydrolase [Bacteroides sp. 214]NDW12083.1 beta-xylosidase [Bacteroides sp. 214]